MGIERVQDDREDGARVSALDAAPAGLIPAPGPGLRAVLALVTPTPAAIAAVFAAHRDEHAAIAAHVQKTFGNAVALDVVRAAPVADLAEAAEPGPAAKPAIDPDGPLGESTGLDPSVAAADQLARGQHDENTLTNEVFWQLFPALRGVKLKAGTPAAAEWLRVRDDAVRPAVKQAHAHAPAEAAPVAHVPKPAVEDPAPPAHHDAPATLVNHDDAGAAGIRAAASERPVAAAAFESDDAEIQALFDWAPAGQAGDRGEAAWLLAALATGLIDAHANTKQQLAQMMAGDQWIHSTEKEPGKGHQQQVEGVKRTKAGNYDVDVADAPILGVLVALASSRIREWASSGSKKRKHLFTLGTLVRGDVGFGGSQHTRGHAIDIGGMNFNNDKDVLALLDGLPPGKVDKVFADNNDHVHVTVNDAGNFELGFPFQGNFFATHDKLALAQKAAEKDAGEPAEGATIKAEGMAQYRTHWFRSTGTFKGGTWKWSAPAPTGGKARSHLQSRKLKALLDQLDNGAGGDDLVQAAHEDGHVEPAAHDH